MLKFILLSVLFLNMVFPIVWAENEPIVRTVVERHEIPNTNEELQLILIEYQPGASAPVHIHPVTGLNYILEGSAESQYEGEPLKVFKAGDSYQDPVNKKHLVFRNSSQTEPLKFLVACKIAHGQSFSVKIEDGNDK